MQFAREVGRIFSLRGVTVGGAHDQARVKGVSNAYPKDDFDDIPDGGPVGVHRRPPSAWRPVLPFLIVLLLVPLLAWGVATLIQRNVPEERLEEIIEVVAQSEPQSEPVEEVVIEETDVPSAAPDSFDADETEEEVTPEPEPAAPVNHDASIGVFNASGISGYAGQLVDKLANNGFYNAYADNTGNWGVSANTVFYSSPEYAATAEEVAQTIGFNAVVEDAGVASGVDIFVLVVH